MRRHRHVMNALRSQIRPLEGNPSLPGGILPPSVAWLESNCVVVEHDYGNGNVQYVYTCDHIGTGGTRYRCRWARWSNSNAVQLLECNQIFTPHYHNSHGGGEGPQSYGTPTTPPWQPYGPYHYGRWTTVQPSSQPYLDESLSLNYGRVRTNPIPVTQHIREAAHGLNPEGGQTSVCPLGTEVCGDPLPGHAPPCCPIKVQGPTPAGASRRPKLGFRDRLKLSYRLLFR